MNEVNWKEHLPELNELFFSEGNCIKKGSKKYDDFFIFFWRYLSFLRKKGISHKAPKKIVNSESTASSNHDDIWDNLPRTYNPQYCINTTVESKIFDKKFKGKKDEYKRFRHGLTYSQLKDFQSVIIKYIDFNNKQSFAKLKKLHDQQSNLPIAAHRDDILKAVNENQVVIVAGDTGCGKSTQVPQYLLNAGFSNISCTQPRRIAAISLAKRVSYETLNLFGSKVAYKIRFEGTRTKATRILFLTEGLLLRQMQTDPMLTQYSVIILDEVHERHLHSDLLLGMFRNLMHEREDLKLILMSATINLDLFTEYFSKAPVIQVPGRLYPIQVKYHPIPPQEQSSKSERLDPRPYVRILQGIDKKYPTTECGDLLIFLSGMSEIQSVAEALSAYAEETKRWIVLLLHSTLSVEEQDKVFDIAPDGVRKCILSTNIAETSVTIDGVRFICDSGKVKEMNYDEKYKMQKLQEFWISRASAEQRKGRAGRTGPGVCFRLYSQEDFEGLVHYSVPEIRRVPLNSLLLQMKSMGIQDIHKFEFIEAPDKVRISSAIHTLQDQGALDGDESLTPIGYMLSQLPVDIVIGKMLIMGSLFDMIEPVMTIAATLSVQSPLTRNAYNNSEMASRRQTLDSSHGDPFTLLNIYDEWIMIKRQEKQSSRKWSKRRGIEEQRLYEMTNLKRQFRELLQESQLLRKDPGPETKLTTSYERKKRHAEKKRLGDLKRKQNQESRKAKVLKLEDNKYEVEDPGDEKLEEEDINDVKDLQFKLRHDLDKLYKTASEGRRLTLGDITLLKIILASGLYPQVAIGDDCNSYKRDNEQIFHTKSKPFAILHPTGYFANHPDILEPSGKSDSALLQSGLSAKKGLLSHKHQLLTYVSLLETMKPYVCNTMRVPALQTCLLFARSLDTNESCTRVIADDWIEFVIKDDASAQNTIAATVQLRNAWESLLNIRLRRVNSKKNVEAGLEVQNENLGHTLKLQKQVAKKLTEFLDSKVEYRLTRVRSAYRAEMYVGAGYNVIDTSATPSGGSNSYFSLPDAVPHPTKGGMVISKFLVYNCLKPLGSELDNIDYIQTVWTCPKCELQLPVTVMQRLQHQAECGNQIQEENLDEQDAVKEEVSDEKKKMLKEYYCDVCEKILNLTSVEVLKHKRSHK